MILGILLTLFLVFLNGFFVAAEFAIVKVRASQIELLIKEGSETAAIAKNIVSHLDAYLSATQLGITLASLGLGWIGESVVAEIILEIFKLINFTPTPQVAHGIAIPISFSLITILHIVFGELAPKSLAIQKPEATTMTIAYPLRAFYFLFSPFIWILNGLSNAILKVIGIEAVKGEGVHSPEEIKYLVKQGKDEGTIEDEDYDLIKNAFDFPDITANSVMLPISKVEAINANVSGADMIDKVIQTGYSRIPVYDGTIDNIIGLVYVKDVLAIINKKEAVHIKDILRPILFLSPYQSIAQVLRQFQRDRLQMGVVIGEFGETLGIVTLEDVLEELVGDIQDESDEEQLIVEKLNDNNFRVIATAGIMDINKHLPHPLPVSKNYDTLAGLLLEAFGHIPAKGEKVSIGDYEFLILKASNIVINVVQVRDLSKINQKA